MPPVADGSQFGQERSVGINANQAPRDAFE